MNASTNKLVLMTKDGEVDETKSASSVNKLSKLEESSKVYKNRILDAAKPNDRKTYNNITKIAKEHAFEEISKRIVGNKPVQRSLSRNSYKPQLNQNSSGYFGRLDD